MAVISQIVNHLHKPTFTRGLSYGYICAIRFHTNCIANPMPNFFLFFGTPFDIQYSNKFFYETDD